MVLMTKQLAFIMLAILLLSAVTVVTTLTVEQADAFQSNSIPSSIKDKQRNTSLDDAASATPS